jgi:hypothetical protein
MRQPIVELRSSIDADIPTRTPDCLHDLHRSPITQALPSGILAKPGQACSPLETDRWKSFANFRAKTHVKAHLDLSHSKQKEKSLSYELR